MIVKRDRLPPGYGKKYTFLLTIVCILLVVSITNCRKEPKEGNTIAQMAALGDEVKKTEKNNDADLSLPLPSTENKENNGETGQRAEHVRTPSEGYSDSVNGRASGNGMLSYSETLLVYKADPLLERLIPVSTIKIPIDINRELALKALLVDVNKGFSRKRIERAGIENDPAGDILLLNLIDIGKREGSGSWYDIFQGSAGGAANQAFLIATFLQKQYKGSWFDGIRFLLNGRPMEEMDHVNLSGTFLRNEPLERYISVPVGKIMDELGTPVKGDSY